MAAADAHNIELIRTLAYGLVPALGLGYLSHRLGLSPIVGFLVAGIVVSPYTPGVVINKDLADQMAEIGVILLMFGVGLHFRLDELLAVRRVAIPGALGQGAAATLLGLLIVLAFGWGWAAGLVFGLALAVSSTVVLTRVLADSHELHTPTGHIAVGWLVVEDLLTVLVLVLLPPLFGDPAAIGYALAVAVLGLALLMVLAFPVGGRVIPWLLNKVAETKSRELFTLTVLVVALGIALGSSVLFGVSMALGAFLAGMVVGRSEFSLRAASDALPMRDAFAVLFFVSVGMQFDPRFLVGHPLLVAAALAVVMVAKPLAALLIVRWLGYPPRTTLSVALGRGQIGEFSFILATVGMKLNVLPPELTSALVAAAIVSISLNPLVYRAVGPIEAWAMNRPRLGQWLTARVRKPGAANPRRDDTADSRFRAVVVGYGPVGRTLARLLRENGVEPTVVEMNVETVRQLREAGQRAVYGDAARPETLKAAGVADADNLVLSASGLKGAEEVVRLARELNPEVRVLARSAYLRERADLRKAGADEVYAGEGEVALAMAESVLRELGAGPEQIDRERERVRADLFGEPVPEKADVGNAPRAERADPEDGVSAQEESLPR
jgi:CPA2 family monovalent cation:H+ antiporter-2